MSMVNISHTHSSARQRREEKRWRSPAPLRLKRLVKVLPHPGTGQTKWASFLLLLALATWVAVVVTCCFSTWRMGGRRHGTPTAGEDAKGKVVDPRAVAPGGGAEGMTWAWL